MKKTKNLLLFRNLIYSLILFEKIKTTKAKAKAIKGLVDRLVNKIKKGDQAAERDVLKFLPKKEIVNKLAKEIVPSLTSRSSGYTRMIKIGEREGDGAAMVMMEWVKDEVKEEKIKKPLRKTRKVTKDVKTNKEK